MALRMIHRGRTTRRMLPTIKFMINYSPDGRPKAKREHSHGAADDPQGQDHQAHAAHNQIHDKL